MNTLEGIRRLRAVALPAPRRRVRIQPPVWPEAIAQSYFVQMSAQLRYLRSLVSPSFRRDADLDPWVGIMVEIEDAVKQVRAVYSGISGSLALQAASQTTEFQRLQMARQLRDAFGVDVGLMANDSPIIRETIRDFARANAALINDLPDQAVDRIAKLVEEAATQGRTQWEVADAIEEAFDVTERRAAFIARDQIGKLYGQMDRIRQKDIGVDRYIWNTMRDARVRDSHAVLEGKKFAWDDPPTNDRGEEIIPGSDYNCRCWAMPDVSRLDVKKLKRGA